MPREHISEEIKLAVRSHCGFGCVICGEIACDYEHIDPYSDVKEHKAENIVMLCVKHHAEVTRGRMSKQKIRDAQRQPYSRKLGRTAFYQFEGAPQKVVMVGGNLIILDGCPRFHVLLLRNTPVICFHLDEGVPLLSLTLRNDSGEVVLDVDKNQIKANVYNIWDVRLTGTKFEVRRKSGDVLFRAIFDHGEIHIERLKIKVEGHKFYFKENGTSHSYGIEGGMQMTGFATHNVMHVSDERALFRLGDPEKGKPRIGAFFAIGLPGDSDD